MRCFCMLHTLAYAPSYFDTKPMEPLGTGLGEISCFPYRRIDNGNVLYHISAELEKNTSTSYMQNFAVWTWDPAQLQLNSGDFSKQIATSEIVLEDFINIIGLAEDFDTLVTIVTKKYQLGDRFAAECLLHMIYQFRDKGINHLAFRGCNGATTRAFISRFARLFNIKYVSAPQYDCNQVPHTLTRTKEKAGNLQTLFATTLNHGTPDKPIIVSDHSRSWHLAIHPDVDLDAFYKNKEKAARSPSVANGKFLLYYLVKSPGYQIFPSSPEYLASLQVFQNPFYETPVVPKSTLSSKMNVRDRIRAFVQTRIEKHRERKRRRRSS